MLRTYGEARRGRDELLPAIAPDAQAHVSMFCAYTNPFAGMVACRWPREQDCYALNQTFSSPGGAAYLVGERRLGVVVHGSNPLTFLRLTQLQTILADRTNEGRRAMESDEQVLTGFPGVPSRSPPTWYDLGGSSSSSIRVYGESKSSWTRECLHYRAMRCRWELARGGGAYRFVPFRQDYNDCLDGDDVIQRVRRDPAAVGFLEYSGQRLKGVKLLAIEDDFPTDWPLDTAGHGPLLPLRGNGTVDIARYKEPLLQRPKQAIVPVPSRLLQPEYPLSEPLLLFVHPKAPQNVKDFATWCVSEQGAAVAESLGLITPFADAQTKAQQRLADLRAGKGEILNICGPGPLKLLARDLTLALTRSIRPIALKYEPEETNQLARLFLEGKQSLMLSWGVIPTVGQDQRWETLKAKGVKTYTIGARVGAVVLNSRIGKTSLTPEQLKMVLSGTVRDWRALDVPDGQLDDNAITLFLPPRKNAFSQLAFRTLGVTNSAPTERLDTDTEILAAVSQEENAIGIVNLTSLPPGTLLPQSLRSAADPQPSTPAAPPASAASPDAKPAKPPFIVLALTTACQAPADLWTGGYPLIEPLVLYIHPSAGTPASQTLLDSLQAPPLQRALRDRGVVPLTP